MADLVFIMVSRDLLIAEDRCITAVHAPDELRDITEAAYGMLSPEKGLASVLSTLSV
jgi:hypothetical protein